jgi:hypothetical protein
MLAGIAPALRAVEWNDMKTQFILTKVFITAIAAMIATAPSEAADALVVYGDFNNDGLVDVAAVTSATTITISLANRSGGYTVSAILAVSQKQKIASLYLDNRNGDGNLDVYANCPAGGNWWYTYTWSGHGDGTFASPAIWKWSWPPRGHIGFF